MRKKDVLSILALVVLIIILLVIASFAVKKVLSVVNNYNASDVEYNKTEIVEKLNLIIKEKYVKDYKYAQENNLNIDEIYNSDVVIGYLTANKYIEQLKDIENRLVQDEYYINADSLNTDIATQVINENGSNSNGTKVFKIKKLEDRYMIYFVDKYGEEEEIGELVMKPEV